MVNANHARPLAAFWLLAIAAAVVTAVGLRADGGGDPGHSPPPSRVTARGAPELVLGGVLRPVPSLTAPGAVGLSGPPAGLAATPGAGGAAVEVSGPTVPGPTHKARTKGTGHATTQLHPSVTAAASTATGHGKGRHKTDKARPTATTTPTTHGKGAPSPGRGKGH